MTKQTLRHFIINLLDDENGINSVSHDTVIEICEENGWNDIIQATEFEEGRAFLWEADAVDLRAVVVK